jgi:hypothetical protein
MYRFEYENESIKYKLCHPDEWLDEEPKEELQGYLKRLKETGEITGANVEVGIRPGITGFVYEISGQTLNLVYSILPSSKVIFFDEVKLISVFQRDEWQNHQLEQSRLNEAIIQNLTWDIPQADKPDKIIKSLSLINKGINTSENLGRELGHNAKKPKDVARHGSYITQAGKELKLVQRSRQDRSYIYKVTDAGQRLATSTNWDTQQRLFAEAMIVYYPIQVILEEITRGEKELEVELIQQLIDSRLSPGCYKAKTSYRRAQCLRTWTLWLSRTMGIPIRRKGEEGLQLYIPYIYANTTHQT